ncbi:pyridoxal phosphate enzyme (YggS family) [Arthrobacter stackebrandtii]|uniref:Pyridoxal phosphate homeostasis protein n=1 Tax=Arthrobacter stackebrandtii TaxID=272161 RepID=A0ABS4Z140_9MICC|nr:YggS family pyridoxal phosphate-dependent enzyme [Arthrobacter stackebrandtii]MBP2414674.1 pyridoxal phosphate enzyme (YggS family) [Arthrobacter stackebrandtii]PYH01767.1 YggS family pyridoxal phosphate-dependent enzyme [Arthrobacter stackebrandtii]
MTAQPQYRTASTVEDFRVHLAEVHGRIAAAASRAGRDPGTVTLLPVSKTVDSDRLRLAVAAGCTDLGENKVQEALRKSGELADLPELHWHVIGHLQSNKAKFVARFAHGFQALDRLSLAKTLNNRLEAEGRTLDVMVQVNTSGEDSKFGLPPAEVAAFMQELPAFDRLRVVGLMTLAVNSPDEQRVRACFKTLHALRGQLQQEAPSGVELGELSMGMSGDFELAVEEGATVVRVGQAIFGARALPDSYYWPTGG